MLMRLTSRMRMKAARVLATLYALCLVMPIAGFVLADSALAHCLTAPAQAHVHQTAAVHDHQTMAHEMVVKAGHDHHASAAHAAAADDQPGTAHTGDKSTTPPCCGVMCVSAIPASPFELSPRVVTHAAVLAVSDAGIAGEAPDTLYRPPIVLQSL